MFTHLTPSETFTLGSSAVCAYLPLTRSWRKDFGTMREGRMIDRIDSLCFAAPVFFHVERNGFTCLSSLAQGSCAEAHAKTLTPTIGVNIFHMPAANTRLQSAPVVGTQ
ncbi:hypothetical protein ACUY4R_004485 [Kosakonia sp. BK9b]